MAIWRIVFSKDAHKGYVKLDKGYQEKINKILSLLSSKERVEIKPIKGEDNIYRLRVGKYRVLLKFYPEDKTILVFKIGSRGDVYK